MRAIAGLFVGAFIGWFIGYSVVMARLDELGGFGVAFGSMLAPTAPDTILFTGIGGAVGCLIGLLVTPKKGDKH